MIAERVIYIAIFLAEAISTWLYFDYIYTPAKERAYISASFVLGYSLLYITAMFNSVFFNIAAFFAINAMILKLNYLCEIKSTIFHSAVLTAMMGTAEIIVNLFITYTTRDYGAYTHSLSAFVLLTVFSKILYLLATVIAARLFKPHKEKSEEPSQVLMLCVMPVISLMIEVTFIYIGLGGHLSEKTEILVQISAVMLLLVNIVVLLVYNRIQAIDREYTALQMSLLRDQADAEYYKMLQEQYDAQRILIHDAKKHFSTISMMAADGESKAIINYISELEALPEFKNRARLCNDPVLNMVLLRYMDYSLANGISFLCDIRTDSVSFMDAASITSLFANLLSNAVEAAEKSEEKMVDVSVIRNPAQNNVLVSVVNSCDVAPVKDVNSNFKSLKGESKTHGYGTKSIIRVVKSYKGSYDFRYDENEREFHSVIYFPISEQTSR